MVAAFIWRYLWQAGDGGATGIASLECQSNCLPILGRRHLNDPEISETTSFGTTTTKCTTAVKCFLPAQPMVWLLMQLRSHRPSARSGFDLPARPAYVFRERSAAGFREWQASMRNGASLRLPTRAGPVASRAKLEGSGVVTSLNVTGPSASAPPRHRECRPILKGGSK